jgi:hypothetical protein
VERRPDPAPLETNDVAIVGGGSLLWAIAAVVLLVLKAAGKDVHDWWWQMCVAGAALGAYGTHYCVRRRRRLRESSAVA